VIDYSSLVRLVVKLSGVGLIVYGALTLSLYLPAILSFQRQGDIGGTLPYVFSLSAPFLIGSFLWWFPATVTNSIIRFDPSAEPKTGWSEEFERVGVSLLGLYLFFVGVSDIIYHALVHRAKTEVLGYGGAPSEFPALMAATVVEIVLAILFMLKSRGVVNLLRKARGY
jgi:hypothetical protein